MSNRARLAELFPADCGLGLRSGTVQVVPHNPRWANIYGEVSEVIADALGDLAVDIEHIGSTSVPDLLAKPLLDIAVGATQPIDDDAFIEQLQAAGFNFEADLGIYGGLLFTVSSAPGTAVAHVHVVDINDFQWRWYLTFRDGLRSDPALVASYANRKRDAAAANEADRDRYNKAKFDWVLRTVSDLDHETPGTTEPGPS